ncbi:hypothetical protein K435DRAFT_688540, partial [Dendrothele bispora CBS 962.96]
KLERRQNICAVMQGVSQDLGNAAELQFWTSIQESLEQLGTAGMSDEEDGREGSEMIKVVTAPDFRHADFQKLYRFVDEVRFSRPQYFSQVGRKRMKRVQSAGTIKRTPPTGLPQAFLDERYLQNLTTRQLAKLELTSGQHSIPK